MDESELLTNFHSLQPAEALAYLFEAYADRIYRLGLSLLQNEQEAEDVVQQTFLNALVNRHRFEGRSSLGSWLFRIAYNASHDRLRRRTEDILPSDDPAEPDDMGVPAPRILVEWCWNPELVLQNKEAREYIQSAVYALPESLRTVFHLREVEALSVEETAEVVGISPSAVKVRLHRARLALREALAVYFYERSEKIA